MKITLEVLHENFGNQSGIFKYFRKLKKEELDGLELIDRCYEDGEYEYIRDLGELYVASYAKSKNAKDISRLFNYYTKEIKKKDNEKILNFVILNSIYGSFYSRSLFEDKPELLTKLLNYYIKNGQELLNSFWSNNQDLFEKNKTLFKKAINHHIKNKWDLESAIGFCQTAFENNPALFQKVVNYYMRNKWDLHDITYSCGSLLAKNVALFKKVINYYMKTLKHDKYGGFSVACKAGSDIFSNNIELFEKVINYQIKTKSSCWWLLRFCISAFKKCPELYSKTKQHEEWLYKKHHCNEKALKELWKFYS